MSRTYRRKNYEDTKRDSWNNRGRRQAGYYSEHVYEQIGEIVSSYTGEVYPIKVPTYQYAPLDEHEFYRQYWWLHGDGRTNWKDPKKWWRKHSNKCMRANARLELHKYYRREDYEPLFKTRDGAFDWWFYD